MLDAAAETIATAYALGAVLDLTGPVARGEQGEVWRLRTEQGDWAIKRSFADFAAADAQRAGEFQNLARGLGVSAPAAVATPAGAYGCAVAGTMVRVHSWVEVLGPDPMIDPAAVGTTVATLHRAVRPADDGVLDPWFTDPVGAEAWDRILAEARRQEAPFADRLTDFRDELLALEALMTPMDPVQTCHLDLWADNVRRAPGGGLTVLDWDNCGTADPSRELALVLFEYGHTSRARCADLYAAYVAAGGPGRVDSPRDFALLIASLHHSGARRFRHALDPDLDETDRARAQAGMDGFLDDPLTRSTIDEILTVTRAVEAGRSP